MKDSMYTDRLIATMDLQLPYYKLELSKLKAKEYNLDFYTPKFYGHNPLTGMPCTIVFNESSPGRSRVMNWNALTQCWFYSEDAGLTWKRVEKNEFSQYIEKVDCLMDKPEYNGG